MNSKPVDLGIVDTFDNEDYLLGIDFDDYTMGIDGTLRNFPLSRFVTIETLLAMTEEIETGDVIPVLDVSDSLVSSYGRFKGADASKFVQSTQWYDVGYGSGWAAYGNGYHNPNFSRIGKFGVLRGLIKRASGSGTAMFTIGTGFRPQLKIRLPVLTNSGMGSIDIATNGDVTLISGGTSWISLNGLTYSLEL